MRNTHCVWLWTCLLFSVLPGCSARVRTTAQAPVAPAGQSPAQISNVIVVHSSAGYWPGCKDFVANLAVRGAPATIIHGWEVSRTADRIVAARQSGSQTGPLVLVGYSRGANDAVRLTRRLQDSGIKVNKLVLMETAVNDSIPANVESCLNIYQTSDVTEWLPAFRGLPVTVESPETQLTNYNLRFHDEGIARADLNHFTVCRNYAVLGMISEQVTATFESHAEPLEERSETQLVGGRW
ncbi:MAG TPA: thioesterase domain-containing protein [Planctomycetaceae bacterium]|jgi:pimeloyl-ACP methyl ester carboxylesterase